MVYNKIGQSGLYVSRICLGTMAFGGLCDEKESFRIMDEALDNGITFFDSANAYGGGASEEIITKIESGVRKLGPVSAALEGGLDGEGLLRAVLSEFELEILEKHPVEYRCYCSRERVSRALISMGREELSSLIEEQGQAELTCQFCDKVYHYSKEELEELLANM